VLLALLAGLSLSSDSGALTFLQSLSVAASEMRSCAQLECACDVIRFVGFAELIAGDEKWSSYTEVDSRRFENARRSLLLVRSEHSSLHYDRSAKASGVLPLDSDTLMGWLSQDREG